MRPRSDDAIEKGKEGQTVARKAPPTGQIRSACEPAKTGSAKSAALPKRSTLRRAASPKPVRRPLRRWCSTAPRAGSTPPRFAASSTRTGTAISAASSPSPAKAKSLRITEPEPWKTATRIAREVLDGTTFLAEIGGSTHYQANYVRPRWAKRHEEDGHDRHAHLLQAAAGPDVSLAPVSA